MDPPLSFYRTKKQGSIKRCMDTTQQLFNKERETIERLANENLEDYRTSERLSYGALLKHIGIHKDVSKLSDGYLNLFQQDFLVEEITKDSRTVPLVPGSLSIPEKDDPEKKTLYAELIKTNMSTFDAVTSLSKAFGVPAKQISFSGVKDAMAITAQQLAFRNVDPSLINLNKVPGLLLHSFSWGKGILEKGAQNGNHFTIIVRTRGEVDEGHIASIVSEVEEGFYNYYFFQRFGTPRVISHVLGKYLLRRNYKEALKIFLCEKGASYTPAIANLRAEALASFGDWRKIEELYAPFPYTFRRELGILAYLREHPEDYLGALKTQEEQPLFWVYAYASYLFNSYISSSRAAGDHIPPVVPLLLNPKYKENAHYMAQLKKDEIGSFTPALRDLTGYAPMSEKNVCVAKLRVKNVKTKILPHAVIFSFDLPVGAYATTFLSNFFNIQKGEPRPEWVSTERYDSKKELGESSLDIVEKVFADILRKDEQL